MEKMATSLSTYWVKFFTGAGFPLDVATKHAVVFSNNRIKPDMLPDLDKPSLKEMGITLMGDMIAILRYAKKVSEEMTCERFLVDNIDDNHSNITSVSVSRRPITTKVNQPKPQVKKVISKISTITNKSTTSTKPISSLNNSLKSSAKSLNTSQITLKKKPISNNLSVVAQTTKLNSTGESQTRKRKIIDRSESDDDDDDDEKEKEEEEEWTNKLQKRLKTPSTMSNNNNTNGTKNYKILVPRQQQQQQQQQKLIINQNVRSQSSSSQIVNKIEQKRTVFDRLGDSSVTSTTNVIEPTTTFNITGLGSDVLKRNSSVFNRLGDRDVKNEKIQPTNILKNGNTSNGQQPHGILKSKASNIGSTTTVKLRMNSNVMGKISTGTMHADHERNNKKNMMPSSVKQLIKTTKVMKLNNSNNTLPIRKNIQKIPTSKLASERITALPAKARLGLSGSQKQVTFNKIATVKHIKKPGVFSRLGV